MHYILTTLCKARLVWCDKKISYLVLTVYKYINYYTLPIWSIVVSQFDKLAAKTLYKIKQLLLAAESCVEPYPFSQTLHWANPHPNYLFLRLPSTLTINLHRGVVTINWPLVDTLIRHKYPNIRARICKRLNSPEIYSKESIPQAYIAWGAGTSNRVVVPARQAGNRFLGSLKSLQIRAQPSSLSPLHYRAGIFKQSMGARN
jgi:hypothetical protein